MNKKTQEENRSTYSVAGLLFGVTFECAAYIFGAIYLSDWIVGRYPEYSNVRNWAIVVALVLIFLSLIRMIRFLNR